MSSPHLIPTRITMYGADWCRDCRRSKALLDGRGIEYDYIDLEVVVDGADLKLNVDGDVHDLGRPARFAVRPRAVGVVVPS